MLCRKWPVSRSIGARYQVITAVAAAPNSTSPPVTRASLAASPRDRLAPGQPPGAVFELAGDQRRADEDPDQPRGDEEHGPERDVDQGAELVREGLDGALAAGPLAAGQARGEVVVAERRAHRGAEHDRVHREGDEQAQAGYCLGAVLAPADPDHRVTSFAAGPGSDAARTGSSVIAVPGGRCR